MPYFRLDPIAADRRPRCDARDPDGPRCVLRAEWSMMRQEDEGEPWAEVSGWCRYCAELRFPLRFKEANERKVTP
jgi:hypothetical protein